MWSNNPDPLGSRQDFKNVAMIDTYVYNIAVQYVRI